MTPPEDQANRAGARHWESAWQQADQGIQNFPIHTTIIENAKWRYLREDLAGKIGRALEVGCGSGHIGALLADAGWDVTLLDNSPAALRCAERSFTQLKGHERKHYLLGDAQALPFESGVFDLVVSCGLLEHFERPETVVAEMARVLKPGGLFYADIVPRKFSLIRLIERWRADADGWYEARLSKRQAHELVTACGLTPMRVFTAGVLPPRGVPGTGRLKLLAWLERLVVWRARRFWTALDGTWLADRLGLYYYITARKPDPPACNAMRSIAGRANTAAAVEHPADGA